MRLPGFRSARVDKEKIVEYLLDPSHPDGGDKAKFLAGFGFAIERWGELAEALKAHAQDHDVVRVQDTIYGTRYIVEGNLAAPDGRHPRIRTVWFIDRGKDSPRLITAYPLKEKSR